MEQPKNQGKHTLYLQLSGITRTTSITNIVADRIGKTTHNNVLFFLSSNSIRLPLTPIYIIIISDKQVACKYSDVPRQIDVLHNGLVTATAMVLAIAVWILMP